MTRKSPYKHPVSEHYREGKFIEQYVRGKGRKPSKLNSMRGMARAMPRNQFKVTIYYPRGRDALDVEAGTFTEAVADGTSGALELPRRVRVRRINK